MQVTLRIILNDYTIIVQMENNVPVQMTVNGPDEKLKDSIGEKFVQFFPSVEGQLLVARLAILSDTVISDADQYGKYEEAVNELIELLGVPPAQE